MKKPKSTKYSHKIDPSGQSFTAQRDVTLTLHPSMGTSDSGFDTPPLSYQSYQSCQSAVSSPQPQSQPQGVWDRPQFNVSVPKNKSELVTQCMIFFLYSFQKVSLFLVEWLFCACGVNFSLTACLQIK